MSLIVPGYKKITASVALNQEPASRGIAQGWEAKGVKHVRVYQQGGMLIIEGYAPESTQLLWTPENTIKTT